MATKATPDTHRSNCPCRIVLDRIADKWTTLVIGQLESGPKRFTHLKKSIEGVSQKMLTQTLRGLERDGIVLRTVYPTVPVTVTYELTELGRSITKPLAAIHQWSELHHHHVQRARERYDERQMLSTEGGARQTRYPREIRP